MSYFVMLFFPIDKFTIKKYIFYTG